MTSEATSKATTSSSAQRRVNLWHAEYPLSKSAEEAAMAIDGAFMPSSAVAIDGIQLSQSAQAPEQEESGTDSASAPIKTSQQFFAWFDEIEARQQGEQEETYLQYRRVLKEHHEQCQDMKAEVKQTLQNLSELRRLHSSVSQQTSAVHVACEALLLDEKNLVDRLDGVETRLQHFKAYDSVRKLIASPALAVFSEQFRDILDRVDASIDFLIDHPEYVDAHTYLSRFRHLRNKALSLAQRKITTALKTIQEESHAQRKEGKTKHVQQLLADLEQRADRGDEYANLMQSLYSHYYDLRHSAAHSAILDEISKYVDLPLLPNAVGKACQHLKRFSERERRDYLLLFSSENEGFENMVDSMVGLVYMQLRPRFRAKTTTIQNLVDACHVVKVEILEDTSLVPGVLSCGNEMKQDMQERIVFLAQVFVERRLRKFSPTASQIDYPAILEARAGDATTATTQTSNAVPTMTVHHELSLQHATLTESSPAESNADPPPPASTSHDSAEAVLTKGSKYGWYPPVHAALILLSQLDRSLEKSVFEGIAQEVLDATLHAVKAAVERIKKAKSLFHAHLFLIEHLIVLREQIHPFDISFSVSDTGLDFSNLRGAVANLVSHSNQFFRFDRHNPLLTLLMQGVPTVTRERLDGKKEIDGQLRDVCRAFIQFEVDNMVNPVRAFIDAVEGMPPAERNSLSSKSKFTTARLRQVHVAAEKAMATELEKLRTYLKMYLRSNDTEDIIFRPIQNGVLDAVRRAEGMIRKYYSAGEQAEIQWPPADHFHALLSLSEHSPSLPLPLPLPLQATQGSQLSSADNASTGTSPTPNVNSPISLHNEYGRENPLPTPECQQSASQQEPARAPQSQLESEEHAQHTAQFVSDDPTPEHLHVNDEDTTSA